VRGNHGREETLLCLGLRRLSHGSLRGPVRDPACHGAYLSPGFRQPLSYEGTPPLLSAILIGLFIYAPLLPFGSNVAGGATVGMLVGYVTYMGVHHALHHLSPRPGSFLYAL
jgi:hypothetical protein